MNTIVPAEPPYTRSSSTERFSDDALRSPSRDSATHPSDPTRRMIASVRLIVRMVRSVEHDACRSSIDPRSVSRRETARNSLVRNAPTVWDASLHAREEVRVAQEFALIDDEE